MKIGIIGRGNGMKVKELIEELKKMPQDKKVEIGTLTLCCGEAARVIEYDEHIEIESNDD